MSRTTKDKKWQLRYGNDVLVLDVPDQRKKKKQFNPSFSESTPSWWTRMMMNRPQRREGHMWESEVINYDQLDDVDPPCCGKKPHLYYG